MDESGFESDFLSASRVVLWGLGLMGGSLAMALNGKCCGLVGIDADPATVAQARERKIVDAAWHVEEALSRPGDILAGADLIVLATPVRTILSVLGDLPALCPGPAVILDMGSTKRQIVAAMDRLPARFDPVGGHPMCGKEKNSLQYADAGIYRDAVFALVGLERTSERARRLVTEMVQAVGARSMWMGAEEHDRRVAATSHVPFLLASALARATPAEAAALVGPGFRSASRLAGSSAGMMVDILATNTDNVLAALRSVRSVIEEYESLLVEGSLVGLAAGFEEGSRCYRELTG
jgi:prephenate dehydrogenase